MVHGLFPPVTQKKGTLQGKLQGPDRRTLCIVNKESQFYPEGHREPRKYCKQASQCLFEPFYRFVYHLIPHTTFIPRGKVLSSLHLLSSAHLSEP